MNRAKAQQGGQLKYLFDAGSYAVFWAGNHVTLFQLGSNGQPIAIPHDQGCADVWNAFELTLKNLNVLPIQAISAMISGKSSSATNVGRRAAVAPASVGTGDATSNRMNRGGPVARRTRRTTGAAVGSSESST